jgi:NAD(P)-dependent dehydrogenase (short-subunit alcohol dehydrogenase family)
MMKESKAVVFGGSSGIGAAVVSRLAERGYVVFAVGRDAEKVAAVARATKGKVEGFSVDATERAAVDAMFKTVGDVQHVVFAHSGGRGAGAFASLSLDDLRSGLEAKLLSHFSAAQASLPYLSQGGSLTFLTAISARASIPGTVGLAAINGAIEAMIRTLARELAPTRVNGVAPGVIDTPWWNGMPVSVKEAHFQRAAQTLPVGRIGAAAEVADAVLLCVENGFMTGTVIDVAGGAQLP